MLWLIFAVAVVALLALDLGVFHRRPHEIKFREALGWSAAWFTAALLFMWVVYFWRGSEHAVAFLTGYLVEWSLSADNVFVFLVIFSYFRVPAGYQHKVLFWGIVGAVIMRAIMITAGVVLIHTFHWIVYLFGAFLIFTGVHVAFQRDQEIHPERNPVVKLVRRMFPMTKRYHGPGFFIRRRGAWIATPLVLVLAVIESTDVVFAVDSVPAVLAITTDPFIVFTSNIFAILGLRSLYFVLAGVMPLFHYLRYGLAVILAFVGAKMMLSDVAPIPTPVALGVVALALLVSIALSLLRPRPVAIAVPAQPTSGGGGEVSERERGQATFE
ncbi:MAG: TerC family protein [Gemmatimonadetes bacterium]|nr:TerC family protein [Gemmatimonadota bacterium]